MTMHQMMLAMGGTPLAFDAASSAQSETTSPPLSWSHTCSGADRALLVGASFTDGGGGTRTVSSITYNSVALTFVGRARNADGEVVELWKLSNPASGANTITVTLSDEFTGLIGGAVSFTGAHQTTASLTGTVATATGGANTTATVNASSASGEIVIDCLMIATGTITAGNGQTERWNRNLIETGQTGGGSTEAGAASVTMSWTLGTSTFWAIAAVSVKPA